MSRSKQARRSRKCDCGRPLRDEFLCPDCTAQLRITLHNLPSLLVDAEDAAYRLNQITNSDGGHSTKGRELALPFRPIQADVVAKARGLLTTWVRDLLESRGLLEVVTPIEGPWCDYRCSHQSCVAIRRSRFSPPVSMAAMCDWLATHVDAIKLSPQASQCAASFARLKADLLEAVDYPPSMLSLGVCDDCQRPMYVEPGERWHVCKSRGCKAKIYDVDERRAQLLKDAANVVASPQTIATALTAFDKPVTEERIWKWKESGRLIVRKHYLGRPWYRLGDVEELYDHALALAERRATERFNKAHNSRKANA